MFLYVTFIMQELYFVCYYSSVGTNNYILCVNAGSSSIKLTAVPSRQSNTGSFSYEATAVTDYEATVEQLLSSLFSEHPETKDAIIAVGHRIVHGGPQSKPARLLDDVLLGEIETYADFAPQHMPTALAIIRHLRNSFYSIPHVVCFDTAFFHSLPRNAQLIALPRSFQAMGVRRYGFHGLSYEYLLKKLVAHQPRIITEKIVFAHLGSGASVAAIDNAQPVETTMGFTPTSGLVMSSRLGETDPSLITFLHKQAGTTFDDWSHIINKESGLLGVSDLSADMYELLQAEATNVHAKEAVELFIYRVQKAIGEMSAAMGGVDRIVFSGGIGEKSPILRGRIVDKLAYLGFTVDPEKNDDVTAKSSPHSVHNIYTKDSKPIQVVHTDENESIATHVRNIINHQLGAS